MTRLQDFAVFLARARDAEDMAWDRLRLHLVDTVGAAIVGANTPMGNSLLELADPRHGGVLMRGTLDDIALGVASVRHTEMDDIHIRSCVTPSSVIVPTVLVMSGRLGIADPERVGSALLAGYEAICRLGAAINGAAIVYEGVWPTYYCAPFGAAAATTRLLGLSIDDTAQALAIALTQCAGRAGPPSKPRPARWLLVGQAARAGAAAALAAQAGFTAELGLLDTPWLANAFGGHARPDALFEGTDGGAIVDDLSMKPFCTAKQVASSLAALMDLMNEGLDPGVLESLRVFVPERYRAMIDGHIPGATGFADLRYQLALAAFHPEGLFDAVRANPVADSRLEAFMRKITVEADPALERHLPDSWPARIEATLPSGKLTKTVTVAPGDPGRAFDEATVRAKIHASADHLIGEAAVSDWIAVAAEGLRGSEGLTRLLGRFDALLGGGRSRGASV